MGPIQIGLVGFLLAAAGCARQAGSPDRAGTGATVAAVHGRFVPAAAASLAYPARAASHEDGTLFFSDPERGMVFEYRHGKRSAILADMDRPLGVEVRGDRLFAASGVRGSVEVYDWKRRDYLFSLGSGPGEFSTPNSVAVSPDGSAVFVVDGKADSVKEYDAAGSYVRELGSPGSGDGEFSFPIAVAVDAQRVVVADQLNHRVQVFGADGAWKLSFGGPVSDGRDEDGYRGRFTRIQAVALRGSEILALDSYHGYVEVFDEKGVFVGFLGRRGTCATCVDLPLDIAISQGGGVLITDPERGRWVTVAFETRPEP